MYSSQFSPRTMQDFLQNKIIWDFSDYILGGFDKKVLDTEDKKFLNHKIYNLAIESNNKDDTDSFFKV
jgi:hypothetical protein